MEPLLRVFPVSEKGALVLRQAEEQELLLRDLKRRGDASTREWCEVQIHEAQRQRRAAA